MTAARIAQNVDCQRFERDSHFIVVLRHQLEPRNWLPLSLRKRVQRASAAVRGEPAVLVYGSAYQLDVPGVPLDNERSERILSALVREGLVGAEAIVRPHLVSLAKLERVHDRGYLARLASPEVMEDTFGLRLQPSLAARVVELQRYATGGTLLAARAARHQRKLAVNLGGGFHHAHGDRGRGFCLINDIAVAIAELRARGMNEAIAVVDLDLHDGDGTRALFADDPSVWTFSIHNAHWGATEALSSTAIALGDALEDRDYLRVLETHLPAMLDQHRPQLVFYLAGCDPAVDDRLGNWNISAAAMLERDRYVIEQLRVRGIEPIVWLLAGGYGAEAWRYSARGLIAALGGPREPELPTTEALRLARYRDLAGVLDPRDLSGLDDELEFDESDLFGAVPPGGVDGPAKLLDYYTRDGVELALERYGILPRLRKLGYEPRVEIDCDRDDGDMVRVFGDPTRDLLLCELRVLRDRQTLPGEALLRIEWLLLQNPRAAWTAGRAPLPGQTHPGLGMFDDISLIMLMACERLGLRGIVVVPSHYHVASHWHGRMHFVDPVVEGRFRALERVFADVPLAQASRAVELDRVREVGAPERLAYEPSPMVMPASDTLARQFDVAWERRAAAVAEQTQFEWRT